MRDSEVVGRSLAARLPSNWKHHLEIQWKRSYFKTSVSIKRQRRNLIAEGD